jgi:hypothetical protein
VRSGEDRLIPTMSRESVTFGIGGDLEVGGLG